MAEENFSDIGRVEAVARLYEGTPFKPYVPSGFDTTGKGRICSASRLLLEGIDFNLVYFPLKHLGYKAVIAVTGELYAALARPRVLTVRLGLSAKLDLAQTRELFSGMVESMVTRILTWIWRRHAMGWLSASRLRVRRVS